MSVVANLTPLYASDITLFKNSLVLSSDTTGELGSPSYSILSPPTIIRSRCVLFFNWRKSHMRLACVTFTSVGTWEHGIKIFICPFYIFVLGLFLPTLCASLQFFLDSDCVQVNLPLLDKSLSIVCFVPVS